MSFNFVTENEHARIFAKRQSLNAVAEFEIHFKRDMTCLRQCKEVSKELFEKLMFHLKDYMMKATMYTEIDYEYRARYGEVVNKTATYCSSKDMRYLCLESCHQFYNKYMNVLIQRYRQYLCIPEVKVTKVKWIGIKLFRTPRYDKRGMPIKFQPIVRYHVPTRRQLTNFRYHEKINER